MSAVSLKKPVETLVTCKRKRPSFQPIDLQFDAKRDRSRERLITRDAVAVPSRGAAVKEVQSGFKKRSCRQYEIFILTQTTGCGQSMRRFLQSYQIFQTTGVTTNANCLRNLQLCIEAFVCTNTSVDALAASAACRT